MQMIVYPPTEEQLNLINPVFFLDGSISLILLRIISLTLLIISLIFWIKIAKKFFNKFIAYTGSFLILLSPAFMVLWLCHPIDCIKLLAIVLTCHFFLNKKYFFGAIFVSFAIILCLNIVQFKKDPAIFHKFSLNDAQVEVTNRFSKEDTLTEKVPVPLLLRRVSYNKYFIEYKVVISEILAFFDIESVFFQEMHPLDQKSVVLFFWPEIFLFVLGLFWIADNKFKYVEGKKIILLFFGLSFVNFIFSSGALYRRFFIILLPVSLILAIAFEKLRFFANKKIILSRICLVLFTVLIGYGFWTNYYDFSRRTDYWLDNRPIAYDFIFKKIKELDYKNYKTIYVTSIVGKPEKYCRYYLKDCKNFVFDSFDLKTNKPASNSLYSGFAGEFIGSDFKNDISSNWSNQIRGLGLEIIDSKNLRDTIAYKFGNDIVVASYR